jgi:hypothetical protein
MFWQLSVMARPIIRARQHVIEIAYDNSSLRIWAGNFIVYGPPIGSCAKTKR